MTYFNIIIKRSGFSIFIANNIPEKVKAKGIFHLLLTKNAFFLINI